MSLIYNGEHQICFWKKNFLKSTFTVGDRYTVDPPKFSWDDFHLVPLERPFVTESKPNYSLVSIVNSNKRVNITPYLPGGMTYESRTGEWEFAIDHDQWGNWIVSHHELEKFFNGSKMLVALNDDPSKIYEGRISLKEYTPGDSYSKIKIAYDLDPENLSSTQLSGVMFRVRFIGPYNTVLQGSLNSYGSAPYYGGTVPSSEGTSFDKWSPSPSGVVGNADYKADYKSTSTNVNLPPVRIEVTTLPNVTTYGPGTSIDITGIEVTAYDKEDNVWGIVPFNELTITPGMTEYYYDIVVDENGIPTKVIYINTYNPNRGGDYGSSFYFGENTFIGCDVPSAVYFTRYNGSMYVCTYGGTPIMIYRRGPSVESVNPIFSYYPITPYSFQEAHDIFDSTFISTVPESSVNPLDYEYGTQHGSQIITVMWKRPTDNLELSTSYEILVGQQYSTS